MYSNGLMQYMFSHHSRHYLMQHVEVGIPWSTPSFRVLCSFHSVLPSYGSSESATLNQLMGRQRTHVGGYYGLSCKGFMPFLLMSIYVIRKQRRTQIFISTDVLYQIFKLILIMYVLGNNVNLLSIQRYQQIAVCIFLKKYFIHLFLERREGKDKEKERNISVWVSLTCPPMGTWPAIQACVLTGK